MKTVLQIADKGFPKQNPLFSQKQNPLFYSCKNRKEVI